MITVLFPVNALKIGGAEQQLLELVRGLDKRSFRPIVAPLFAGGALEGEFRAVGGAEVVDLRRRGKFDMLPFVRIAALLRSRGVDVVQPFLTPATLFGLLPALVVGTPVKIVTERCGVRRVRGLGNKVYRSLEDTLTHFADAAVPNSASGRDDLLRRGIPTEKIRVIYNGVNTARLRPEGARIAAIRATLGVTERGAVIGILASLTPPKGHVVFLRAARALSEQHPGARFAIVGDGPLRGELEAMAASLGIADRTVFFGYQRDVASHLGAFDVLVSASLDNEGSSNSLLEAMALGVPVVATEIGGNGEIVHQGVTGHLVPASDPAALAGAVTRILSDAVATAAVTARARELVSARFSLEGMVGAYEALYRSLLDAKRVPAGRPQTVPL